MTQHKSGAVPQQMQAPMARPAGTPPPPNLMRDRAIAAMDPDRAGAVPALQDQMAIVIKHLHAMIDELMLGEPDLLKVYAFLNRVGQNGDMMLLGDHFGLSMRANDIAYYGPIGTAPNVIGPLYREEAPFMQNPGAMVDPDEPGRHIFLHGQVRDAATGQPLAGAVLDFWQSNEAGFYEDQDPDMPDYHFRRRIKTDAKGHYGFRTIVPGAYEIANRDTPVTDLMIALGRQSYRAPHIHLMVDSPDYTHLTTLIYFEGEPVNAIDCIFSCRPENIATIEPNSDGDGLPGCRFDIELVRI